MNDDLNVGDAAGAATATPPAAVLTAEQVADISAKAAAQALEAAQRASAARRAEIMSAVAGFEHVPAIAKLRDEALASSDISVDKLRADVLEEVKRGIPAMGNISVGEDARSKEISAIETVLLARAAPSLLSIMRDGGDVARKIADAWGLDKPETFLKAHRAAEGDGIRRLRLVDVAERCVRGAGGAAPKPYRSDDELYRASFSHATSDFPEILSNLGNKILQVGFMQQRTTYERWCTIGSASDFKEQNLLTLSDFPDLLRIPEGSPVEEATLSERREKIAVGTFGRGFSMTREMMKNDDLGAFAALPLKFGAAAARVPEDLAYAVLTTNPKMVSDGVQLFHANHQNLHEAAALSITAVESMYAAFRRMRSFGKEKTLLDLTPRLLLVPTALRATAEKIRTAEKDWTVAGGDAPPNTVRGLFEVVDSPRLDAASSKAWYMACAPGDAESVRINFLDGRREPIVTEVGNGSILGVHFEIVFDCGVAPVNSEAIHKNPGA